MSIEDMKAEYSKQKGARGGARKLSSQELRVIRLAAKGLTRKEIAEEMGLSARTVGVHNQNSFEKIGVNNIVKAINHVNEYYKG